jgi:hypothetical protein
MKALLRIAALIALCVSFLTPSAKAESITYTLTTTNGNTVQFTLPANSEPSAFSSGANLANFYNVSGTFDGQSIVFECIGFYNGGNNPFLQSGIAVGIGNPHDLYAMFFGSGSAPIFSGDASSVQLLSLTDETVTAHYIYTPWSNYMNYLATSNVPEPGSLLLLSLGVIALLGFRSKFTA